jgi:hypothetical protein
VRIVDLEGVAPTKMPLMSVAVADQAVLSGGWSGMATSTSLLSRHPHRRATDTRSNEVAEMVAAGKQPVS